QRRHPAGKHLEAHIVEGLLRSVVVRDVLDGQNRDAVFALWRFLLHGDLSWGGQASCPTDSPGLGLPQPCPVSRLAIEARWRVDFSVRRVSPRFPSWPRQ